MLLHKFIMSKNNRIPEGWMNCPKNGNKLIVKKFMPLKTPLDTRFDKKIPPDDRFHPEEIFYLAKRNRVRFGLWIDLTNTNRYYSREEIQFQGCRYEKLSCAGHGKSPPKEFVSHFIDLIDHFVSVNPRDCIAIHCTHGFNRTGFLIVSFLVERMKFSIGEALELFASYRPPGIYRHEYVVELYNRYGNKDDVPTPVSAPHWSKRS